MKRLILAAILATYLTTAASLHAADSKTESFKAKVINVVDGDTIGVLVDGKEVRVRLEGIDSPESRQEGGPAARSYLKSLIELQEVEITKTGTDKYGRTLGVVSTKKLNVNEKMISEGHAWHFKKYNSDEKLAKLEQQAKSRSVGVWTSSDPVAPWDFRKNKGIQEPGTDKPDNQAQPSDTIAKRGKKPDKTNPAKPPEVSALISPLAAIPAAPTQANTPPVVSGGTIDPKSDPKPKRAASNSSKSLAKENPSHSIKVATPNEDFSTSKSVGTSNRDGRGNFRESAEEKAYERARGVEVVHKKDGTTYERKSRSKK